MAEKTGVVASVGPYQSLKRRGIVAVLRAVEGPERVSGGRIESKARTAAAVRDELTLGSAPIEQALIRRSRLLQGASAEIAARSVNALAVAVTGIADDMRIAAEKIGAEDAGNVGVPP